MGLRVGIKRAITLAKDTFQRGKTATNRIAREDLIRAQALYGGGRMDYSVILNDVNKRQPKGQLNKKIMDYLDLSG